MNANPPEIGAAELASRLRLSIGRLTRQLRHQNVGGLTASQLSALYTVEKHEPIRLTDLACHERISPPTLTRCVASLEDLGLLERRPDPDDRRAALITLSPKGRGLAADLRRERTTMLTSRIGGLDAAQRRALAAALPALEALITDEPPPPHPVTGARQSRE